MGTGVEVYKSRTQAMMLFGIAQGLRFEKILQDVTIKGIYYNLFHSAIEYYLFCYSASATGTPA